MSSVLLHTCCAPCSAYIVERLREQGHQVSAFWYNPNVHPYSEHQRRLEAMRTYAQKVNLSLIVSEGYEMVDYFRAVVGHEGGRCGDCYRLRLSRTARAAREGGFSAFTTTLLISPYQQHELVREVGEEMGEKYGVAFHYEDFRPGFREGHRVTRGLNLYHQRYCGCVYSEWERFAKVKVAEIVKG